MRRVLSLAVRKRLDGLRRWLAENAPYTVADQKHLDADTPERAYWHLGYAAALDDILRSETRKPNT
jgi:hypothetical protein